MAYKFLFAFRRFYDIIVLHVIFETVISEAENSDNREKVLQNIGDSHLIRRDGRAAGRTD